MVAAGDRGRLLEVEGGSGWPSVAGKSGQKVARPLTTEHGLFWATFGLLAVVVVATHGGRDVGGAGREQVVAVDGQGNG